MLPRLKYALSERQETGEVRLYVPEDGAELALEDPHGRIAALVAMLDGTTEDAVICDRICNRFPEIGRDEVTRAIVELDEAGLLEDARDLTTLRPDEIDRYTSNLSFFARYATTHTSRFAMQERLRRSSVVLLGCGGLGSIVAIDLAGLGVGRVTIVDPDHVELRNLTRQFLFRESDIGDSKVRVAARVMRAINSDVEVTVRNVRITEADDLMPSLKGAELLIMAIDAVHDALRAVNEASVRSGVPFIHGGWWSSGAVYYSVAPGRSGCVVCGGFDPRQAPIAGVRAQNPGTAPATTLLGGLVSFEALRFLTGFAPPISPGRVWAVDFATGVQEVRWEWERDPACALCGEAG